MTAAPRPYRPRRRGSLRPGLAIRVGCLAALCLALTAGCGETLLVTLPQPVSPPPATAPDGLRAGFGRVDITPPPGYALAGNGPGAAQARGYRHRLYVRALVLEDRHGERIALAVADLVHLPVLLHRRTAAQLLTRNTGIGADRLLFSATHTHSGPGNFYEARQYNQQSSSLPGYDPDMATFLVTRMADAIEAAVRDLKPAVAAWDTVHVTGQRLTRNRSLEAFARNNPPRLELPNARSRQDSVFAAVDSVWTMLRVDQCNASWEQCIPRGAYSIFAIHGTGYPQGADLADGDVHALVERGLERHLDSLNHAAAMAYAPGYRTETFHLFANGTEGDVSPNYDPDATQPTTRCEAFMQLKAGRGPGGSRRPPPPEELRATPDDLADCLDRARRSTNAIGHKLTRHAIRLFDKIGRAQPLSRTLEIKRAFATVSLRGLAGADPLCPEPRSGSANFAGAEDARPPMYKWTFLGLFPSDLKEGAARKKPSGCHGHKKIALGPVQRLFLQNYFVGIFGVPEYAQLAVVQVGNTLLAAVPGEPTTVVGVRIKEALRRQGPPVEHRAVIGLANGFIQYVATKEEYAAQHYEGGSTIYGPNTAAAFTDRLGWLAESLRRPTPVVLVEPIVSDVGPSLSYFAPPDRGPRKVERAFTGATCAGGEIRATWLDAYPGRLLPADGQVLEIQHRQPDGSWKRKAWDDDAAVEVRATKPRGKKGHLWQVRWVPEAYRNGTWEPDLAPGRYRVILTRGASPPYDHAPAIIVECGAVSGGL